MHQEPWEPADSPTPPERKPNPNSSDAEVPQEGSAARSPSLPLPLPLLNWQVVEIEGESTLIEETEIQEDGPESVKVEAVGRVSPALDPVDPGAFADRAVSQANPPAATIRDQNDDVVVATMQVRRLEVMPGESADFEVTVANHGRWSALFEISVEGWIDEAWTPDLPLRVQLEPQARQNVTVRVLPPRQPNCRAGEHALAVVVRAARYPGHVTRLAAVLVVERYAALKVGTPQPTELDLSWFVPTATTRLPITNQSNYAATIHLQGTDRERQCDFTFYTDGNPAAGDSTLDGMIDGTLGTAHVTLQPGQTLSVPVEIRTRQRPFFGIMPAMTAFRLVARMDTEPPLRRAAEGQLAVSALIGPWQMAIAAVLGVVALFGTGLAGLALLVALRSTSPLNSAPPAALATPAPAAPVVAFVIQMDQQMPTRVPGMPSSAPLSSNSPAQDAAPSAPDRANTLPSIPVVSADQVTAPGEPTPEGQRPLVPLVVTTPSSGQGGAEEAQIVAPSPASNANLTYGEMFRQVASQFDLDWRMLAAQAYLESGFDSLALSGQGDMGLMQIRSGTWSDWASTVEASDPFDAYSNVLVGAAYLNHLREQLSARGMPQQEWMLVAYNWGPDKVYSHLDAGGSWESLDPERRQYAEDILRIAASIPPE